MAWEEITRMLSENSESLTAAAAVGTPTAGPYLLGRAAAYSESKMLSDGDLEHKLEEPLLSGDTASDKLTDAALAMYKMGKRHQFEKVYDSRQDGYGSVSFGD
ncbi:MAG: hypothetical protein ABEJ69_01690 [Candidatus Nanohaloarchaea archaeon]